jgi:hypothetical protein
MRSKWLAMLREGIVAGVIGYGATIILFALANVLSGRPVFHTAAVLGAALVYGISDPMQVVVTPAYVLAYNGAHLIVFLALGIVGAALARLADRGAQLWYVGLFFFIFISFHLIATVQVVAYPMRSLINDAAIWIAGITAGLLMVGSLLRAHPAIRTSQPW